MITRYDNILYVYIQKKLKNALLSVELYIDTITSIFILRYTYIFINFLQNFMSSQNTFWNYQPSKYE